MKTKAEWQALSKTIVLRNLAYIGGRFQPASSGETFPSINPATEQLLADVASCDKADQDDMDTLLTLLGVAGINFIMGIPPALMTSCSTTRPLPSTTPMLRPVMLCACPSITLGLALNLPSTGATVCCYTAPPVTATATCNVQTWGAVWMMSLLSY